ncbi:uncharacterized protein LOC108671322 [Hyalella azteca]|uniref:Uncharacterized protein LOC108671322 n=1 Tax=Hyalella azteca TaxID=294128 RepID=A0A979FXM9_HYAAZ|nr:uncharacterized protein LOC108671322 [Hyalella azteca]
MRIRTVRGILCMAGLVNVFWSGNCDPLVPQFLQVRATTFHKNCLLGHFSMSLLPSNFPVNFECTRKCMLTSGCRLFCVDPSTMSCDLLDCFVSQWFPGVTPSSNTATFKTCYSSWADARDIIRSNMVTTGSPGYMGIPTSQAIDGYMSRFDWNVSCFSAVGNQPNFIQIDFGSAVKVSEVGIAHRNLAQYFQSVVVRLGNSASETNAVIATVKPGSSTGWTVISLPTPVVGRYLNLRSNNTDNFEVGDVRVIPAE